MINNIFAFLVAPSSCTCIYMFDYSKYIHTQFPPKLTLTRRWLNYKAFSSSWLNRFQASTSIDGGDVNNILLICLKKKRNHTISWTPLACCSRSRWFHKVLKSGSPSSNIPESMIYVMKLYQNYQNNHECIYPFITKDVVCLWYVPFSIGIVLPLVACPCFSVRCVFFFVFSVLLLQYIIFDLFCHQITIYFSTPKFFDQSLPSCYS